MAESPSSEEHPVSLDKTDARQGRLGLPVLYVLIGGIVLALIAWAVVQYAVK